MDLIEAKRLATRLITEYGLVSQGWRFRFDRSVQRLGCCRYRTKTISLSKEITMRNDRECVEDTIRHEIAHALVGYEAGHGPLWKRKAVELGATPRSCSSDHVKVPYKWEAHCDHCNGVSKRYRRARASCGRCSGGKFNSMFLLRWVRIG